MYIVYYFFKNLYENTGVIFSTEKPVPDYHLTYVMQVKCSLFSGHFSIKHKEERGKCCTYLLKRFSPIL